MIERVNSLLMKNCLLDSKRPTLIGVSGGPDSLCLLHIMDRLGYRLIVAYLDHALRSDSSRDADHVRQITADLGLPFCSERVDVAGYAEAHKLSLEEAARIVRYMYLFKLADQQNAQAVVVGHNADDQVETVLMHILRGTGLAGLRGMSYRSVPNTWHNRIALVRPLLGVWREEVDNYIESNGLNPVTDVSNWDSRFFRNRLRHELVPYLEDYNPQVRKLIWRMASTLEEDFNVISKQVEIAWDESVVQESGAYIGFDTQFLRNQAGGIQRHLLRRAIYQLLPNLRDADFTAIERAVDFLNSPANYGRCDLLAGIYLLLEGERVWIATSAGDLPTIIWPQISKDQVYNLPVPGELPLESGWSLSAENGLGPEQVGDLIYANANQFHVYLDAQSINPPLLIRSRRPGDRFKPIGLDGHSIKLADFMVNVKLPRRARDHWPIVISDREIVWVSGYRLAEPFKVKTGTRCIVRLILSRESH